MKQSWCLFFLKIVCVCVCLARSVCVYLNSFLFVASFENGKYELSTFVHVQGFKGYLFWSCCMSVRISLLISIRRKKGSWNLCSNRCEFYANIAVLKY